ncbi:MAG: hypothetical protein WCH46_09600 [bacterium]
MKYLSEITRIVTNFQEQKPEIIEQDDVREGDNAISKLFNGLRNGSITTDQKAAEVIYGKAITDTKFTSLKNRLKRRLLNSLFFLNIRPPTFSEYAAAYYQSNKNLFLVKTLSALGARNTAIKLLESALVHSQKFNITPNSIEFLLLLRTHSYLSGNIKTYNHYNNQLHQTIKTYEAECLAQEYNDRVAINFTHSSAEQPEMQSVIEKYCEELRELKSRYSSKNLYYNFYRIQTISFQISRNYDDAIAICDEASQYLQQNAFLATKPQFEEFALQKLSCLLSLRKYDEGMEAVSQCEALIPVGFPNWFTYMELYFYLAMHTSHFDEAKSVYDKVTSNQRFAFQPDQGKELWKLSELYLMFALRANDLVKSDVGLGADDMKKFLRNVPLYTKDKKGYNVAILILHILVLLQNNEFGEIIGRMDALRTYRTRYLRAGSNKQSALFFRMLQIMETNNFSYELTKQKSARYFEKMKSTAAEFSEIQDGLQVLPFDWLWNKILEMLKQKEEQKIIQKVIK